jgi:hypothetical protein
LRFIFKRVIDFCWFSFKWSVVLGVVAVAAAVPYLYRRVDEEVRSRVEARVAQHYLGLKVTIGRAELVEGEGIKVHDLRILEPGAEGPRPELLHVEEVLLGCQATLKELLQGEPQFTRITIRRPTLRFTRRRDGSWSAVKLLPPPKFSERPIEARIENGIVEIFDPLKNPSSTLTLRDLNLVFLPLDDAQQATATPDARRVQGTLTADHLRHAEFEGLVDFTRQIATLNGSAEGLDISPELHAALPEPLASKLAALAGLRGEGALRFQWSCDPAATVPYRYQLTGHLAQGRIDDPRLPHPLSDLRATVHVDNTGFWVEEMMGHSNQATIRLSCRQTGFEANGPKVIEAEVRQLELDRQLLAALPESLQDQWHKYRPAGFINADAKLTYDGHQWRPDLNVQCLNVSFTYYKFPYRLEEGKGIVRLGKDDALDLHLRAYSGNQEVRLDGQWEHVSTTSVGCLEASGEDIQLDAKLLAAIPEQSRAVMEALHPQGTLMFYVRLWHDTPDQPAHKHMVLTANRCSVRFDGFPYPIGNIHGTLDMLDDSWTFNDLKGFNGTGCITAAGQLAPTLQGNELSLKLTGSDIALDKELFEALRPSEQQLWDVLKPRGMVDLEADIRCLIEQKTLNLTIRAVPQSESTSIEPVHFPYRMERLQGVLWYRDSHVELQNFRAEHGPVKLSVGGYCDFLPDGRWHLHLGNTRSRSPTGAIVATEGDLRRGDSGPHGLSVERLRLDDRELIQALPGQLKKALLELRPSGAVNVSGSLDLEPGPRAGDPVQSQWDIQVGFHRGGIDCGLPLQSIYGSVGLAGVSDGNRFQARGELALDSLNYKDYQFTDVAGPIWIEDQQVLLGSWVARRLNEAAAASGTPALEKPRPLSGRLFGGTMLADGRVNFGQEPQFDFNASLIQADLARCAREIMFGPQNLRGTIAATAHLYGSGRSTNALNGGGSLRLSNADLYELPIMVSLLKLLSVRAPDRNAFSNSTIDFRIAGEHVYFPRIDFNGDAISLLGSGEMNFQQAIKLTFRAIVGRGDSNLPVLREIFASASQQIMEIHIDGTLQNPRTTREPFPGVNKALQQLQAERPSGAGASDIPPQVR